METQLPHQARAKRPSPALLIGVGVGGVVVAALVGVMVYNVATDVEPAPPEQGTSVAQVPVETPTTPVET
ncbi:MAG TPA: hypothetical protein VM238_03565, partial [Phycisphaerae bacterium]|nr:hypothetical protein [Phycisphaerae bacterium]